MFRKAGSSSSSRAQMAFKLVPHSLFVVNSFGGIHQRTGRQEFDTVEVGDSPTLFPMWSGFPLDTTVSHQKLYTRGWTCEKTYTLASNMQVNYRAYFVVARCDVPNFIPAGGGASLTSIFDYFNNGFTDFDSGSTAGGTIPGMTPFNNPRFVNHFKVKKSIRGSLTTTRRTLRLTAKLSKPCEHLWFRYLSPAGATGGPQASILAGKKGLFRGWLVIFEGEPTNSNDGTSVGPVLPTFTTAPFAIDILEKISVNVALMEQNTIQFEEVGIQPDAEAVTQHYNIYMEAIKPFAHNWDTYPVNS